MRDDRGLKVEGDAVGGEEGGIWYDGRESDVAGGKRDEGGTSL